MRQIVVGVLFGFVGVVAIAQGEEPYRVYWADAGNGFPDPEGTGRITRASIDGSRVEVVYTHTFEDPIGIGLDWRRRKMYWTSTPCTCIMRSNLDGSDAELILEWDLFEATLGDIAVDGTGKKIYWTDQVMEKIRRANLDGSDVEDLVTIPVKNGADSAVFGISLDITNDLFYWSDIRMDVIGRANLDGSDPVIFSSDPNKPSDVRIAPELNSLFYTDFNLGVRSIDVCSGEIDLIALDNPVIGLWIDRPSLDLFWTRFSPFLEPETGAIRIATYPDYTIQDVVPTGLEVPFFVEVLPDEIDLSDFAAFIGCLTGPGVGAPPGCESSDFDNDGDVDFADFGRLQLAFTGPFD